MKQITFEKEYFKNLSEWEYFLTQAGVPKKEWDNIFSIFIASKGYAITKKEDDPIKKVLSTPSLLEPIQK